MGWLEAAYLEGVWSSLPWTSRRLCRAGLRLIPHPARRYLGFFFHFHFQRPEVPFSKKEATSVAGRRVGDRPCGHGKESLHQLWCLLHLLVLMPRSLGVKKEN